MKYRIEITGQAKTDLQGIYEHIAFTLLAPENAVGQIDRLEKGIMSLEQLPLRFRKYKTEPWKSRGLHVMTIDNFEVFYIPNEEIGIVNIVRVMYSGRNIDEQLNEYTDY